MKDQPAQLDLWGNKNELHWEEFIAAREYVWSLKLKSYQEWELFISGKFPQREPLPDHIPGNPDQVYRQTGSPEKKPGLHFSGKRNRWLLIIK